MNKHEALAAAVTGIDDELLQEAANGLPAPRRPVFARWGAMAAVLLLVFGIAVLWQQSGALRLSVGNTVIGSRSVPVTQSAAPRTVEEPVMYSDEPLELTLSLFCGFIFFVRIKLFSYKLSPITIFSFTRLTSFIKINHWVANVSLS